MPGFQYYFNSHSHRSLAGETTVVQLDPFQTENLPDFFSVGIHPQHASNNQREILGWLTTIGPKKQCLAIGEIGLDNRFENAQEQENTFIQQLKFAEELKKPVILHCVNSWDRCKFLHSKHAPDTLLIYHGFNKAGILEQVLNYSNAIVSIGASILSNQALTNRLNEIPDNRLLVETDDRDIPVVEIYQKLADLKSLTLRDFKDQIDINAKRIFSYEQLA